MAPGGDAGGDAGALDEDELRRLDEFLRSDATPETCMGLDQLDGFLNALVCGPSVLLPAEYLDQVLGARAAQPDLQIVTWITRLHEDIARQQAGPDDYQPLLRRGAERDGQGMVFTEAWCDGFLRGIVFCQDGWAPHFVALRAQLAPILDFAAEAARADDLLDASLRERALAVADELPAALTAIYSYWQSQRGAGPGLTGH